MNYPGHDSARRISAPPVLLETIYHAPIPTGVVDFDFGWGDEQFEAVFVELNQCRGSINENILYMHTSADNGSTFPGSGYFSRANGWETTQTTNYSTTTLNITAIPGIGLGVNATGSFSIIVPSPSAVGRTCYFGWGGFVRGTGLPLTSGFAGYRNADEAVNALRFKFTGGATWQDGRCRAVGLRKP